MIERRELKRRRLYQSAVVFDRVRQHRLGTLADVTTRGMRLLTSVPFENGAKVELTIKVPSWSVGSDSIDVDAHVVWRRRDADPSVFDVGLEFDSPSDRARWLISSLIAACSQVG